MANPDDWQADGIAEDGTLRHVVPAPMGMRVFLVAAGLFVLTVSTLELWRAVWPPTLVGLFFTLILAGAFSVGVPMIVAGLLAPTLRWTVTPQRIDIALVNPFRGWRVSVGPGGVASISVIENSGDGPSTFRVVLRTVEGKRYESRDYGSHAAADKLRRDIESIFYG